VRFLALVGDGIEDAVVAVDEDIQLCGICLLVVAIATSGGVLSIQLVLQNS
jgi:hypothetical protein